MSLRMDPEMSKRRKIAISDIQDCVLHDELKPLVHIKGTMNPPDALTKPLKRHSVTMKRLIEIAEEGYYRPVLG